MTGVTGSYGIPHRSTTRQGYGGSAAKRKSARSRAAAVTTLVDLGGEGSGRLAARPVFTKIGYASEGNASYLWRRLSKAGLVPSRTSSANWATLSSAMLPLFKVNRSSFI